MSLKTEGEPGGIVLNTRMLLIIVAITGGAPLINTGFQKLDGSRPVELSSEVRGDIAAAKLAAEKADSRLGRIELAVERIQAERDGMEAKVSDHEQRLRAIEHKLR